MRELDRFALFVLAHAELEIGVGELAKDAVGRAGHFALHGEELLFAGAERVRLVADEAFELQLERLERFRVDVLFQLLIGSARISGRMKLVASAASVAACS